MKNVTITISGDLKSGKSTLLYIIKEYLRIYNLNIKYESNNNYEYPEEYILNGKMSLIKYNELWNILKKINIIIKETHC